MTRIVVDGNIGSGKTTQLGLLEKKGYHVQREPLDKWPLTEFYKDPSRWAFYFHMVLLQTLQPRNTRKLIVYERSLLSSRYVFWPVLVKDKVVTPMEDETYGKFYDRYAWSPDLYIFLSKSPEKCYEHIQKRGQAGDASVTLKYLQDLDIEYKKMIKNIPCRVVVLNAEERPAEEIHEEICEVIAEDELLRFDAEWNKVQTPSSGRRKVSCTPFPDMCCVS
jgi:deoxyadenosine/deoxycytidine kinase